MQSAEMAEVMSHINSWHVSEVKLSSVPTTTCGRECLWIVGGVGVLDREELAGVDAGECVQLLVGEFVSSKEAPQKELWPAAAF